MNRNIPNFILAFFIILVSVSFAQGAIDIQKTGTSYVCEFLPDYEIHYIQSFRWIQNDNTVLLTDSRDIGSATAILSESSTLTGVTLASGDTLKCEVNYALTSPVFGILTDEVTYTESSTTQPVTNPIVTITPNNAHPTTESLVCDAPGLPSQAQGFQWYDGNNIAIVGATGNTLTRTMAGGFSVGDVFKCVVTNIVAFPTTYTYGSAMVTITVDPNADAPTASIVTPSTGDYSKIGTSTSFTAIATGVAPLTYSWTSNIDGVLSTQKDFTSTLSIGTHVITFTVTDNNGGTATDSITYTVNAAQAPVVSITSPSDNSEFYEGENISFTASITDADSTLSSIVWSSNIDGILNGNNLVSFSDSLSYGTHTITILVTDSDGLTASDSITIEIVKPESPKVSVVFPNDGDVFKQGDTIPFIADGSRDQITSWIWTSDVDGLLSQNQNFTISTLTPGVHTITLRATDIYGNLHEVEYVIEILLNIQGFKATSIVSPNNFDHFTTGQSLILSGYVDNQNATDSLIWSSSIDGTLGSGNSINVILSEGLHRITFSVVSTNGQISRDYIYLYVDNTNDPTASIVRPFDFVTYRFGNDVFFSGQHTSTGTTNIEWSSDVNGTIRTLNNITYNFQDNTLVRGKHIITFRVDDNNGDNLDKATIYVLDQNASVSSITSPLDNSIFIDGEQINFTVSAQNVITGFWISDIEGVLSQSLSFSTTQLAVGKHIITFIGFDANGEYTITRTTVTVALPQSPTVVITSPVSGQTFNLGENILFSAIANDPDGIITQWQWSSNINGVFGNSQNLNYSSLSLGRHDITVTVLDNDGNRYSATSTIWILIGPSTAPIVTIDTPNNLDSFNNNTVISFTGTAIPSAGRTIVSYSWTSDIQGVISTQEDFTAQLSSGIHTITFVAIDSNLELGMDFITLYINASNNNNSNSTNSTNSTMIINPINGSSYINNTAINFIASNESCNGLAITTYAWASNINGFLSNQQNFTQTLSVGTHTITLVAQDSNGTCTESVTIFVTNPNVPNQAPVAVIQAPMTVKVNQAIQYNSTGSYDVDGTIVSYLWNFGRGAPVNAQNPTYSYDKVGTYQISLIVTDDDGAQTTTTAQITVKEDNGNLDDEKSKSSRESIYIDSIEMPSNGVYFRGEIAQIVVTFKNNLKTSVTDMHVTAISQELGLYTKKGPFKVSRGETVTKELLLDIPSGVSPDEYQIRLSVYNGDHERIVYVPIQIK
ncbi:PKD domain-containing protein [Candidatus Woesearchaeota archaeon]|nr:PKD domain-containing protein [Candidatus Woesearchaeota archaeon]